MKQIYRRLHILSLCLTVAVAVLAQSPANVFANSDGVRADRCAVMIVDLKNGSVVDSHNEEAPLLPASITKAVTIASAIEKSGTAFRYHTRVYLDGPVREGVLEGNLLIEGGGDPSLGANVEPKGTDIILEIIEVLRKNKVQSIAGKIVIDSSIFTQPVTPPSWAGGDLNTYYGTGCHGFNYRRNASGKQAVHDPQGLFVKILTAELKQEGITVENGEYEQGKKGDPILDHQSPPIDDIMRSCMKRSDNLYAEALLRTYALLTKKQGDTKVGAETELDEWKRKGADMEGVWIVDGSGLSRQNRITARFMSDVLCKMAYNVDYVSFFPLAGIEGTLASFLKGTELEGYIAMKTGSMNGVQCYAGYMLDDDFAPTHVVVIMINDFPGARASVRKSAEKMLLDTFGKKELKNDVLEWKIN